MEANYNSRTGIISSDSPTIITLRMVNTLNQNVQVDLQGCLVTIDEVLYQECLPGDTALYPYEIRTISHIPLMLEAGEQTLSVALGAGLFNQLLTLDDCEILSSGLLGEINLTQYQKWAADLDFTNIISVFDIILLSDNIQ